MSPANDKTKALKYLLIRHAWRFKQNIPDSIYDEITNSLTVKALDKGFLVEWMRNKIEYKKIFNKNEFNFFVRGDKLNNKDDYTIDSITNDNYAKMFVKEAFLIEKNNQTKEKSNFFSINPLLLISYFLIPLPIYYFGKDGFLTISVILLLLLFSEFWYIKGKLLIPLIMLGFIQTGLVFTPIVGILSFLISQLLDPNIFLRKTRIILSIVCSLFNLSYIIYNDVSPIIDPWLIIISIISICVFTYNLVFGSHFRSFPLVFPYLSVGFYLDGHTIISILILILSCVINQINRIGFKIFPIQKEKNIV